MAYTTIDKPSDYFNTKLYTGTGSELALTGINFQPDLTWIKNRDTTDSHQLVDSVRSATKNLFSNLTNAEATDAQGLKSFDTAGFTVGTRLGMNTSGESYVGWNWLAGGTASSNTDGSITSSVSANQDAGFSIVSYTGTGSGATNNQTVGHGLVGVTPNVVIFKRRDSTGAWLTYHESLGIDNYVYLNSTDASASASGIFSGYTSSVLKFSVNANDQNASGGTHVAYCFAEKKGYSKFSSWIGNGSDTQFIYTGFAPAFVLWKNTNESDNHWCIIHNKAETFNGTYGRTSLLRPNDSGAEIDGVSNTRGIDFLSNGFCLKSWAGSTGTITANESGDKYIFMCFAESPFTTSTGIPTTAK